MLHKYTQHTCSQCPLIYYTNDGTVRCTPNNYQYVTCGHWKYFETIMHTASYKTTLEAWFWGMK
jgi:hypothetical protein